MGVKVAKFGGSSVADSIQLRKLKKIIDADPDRKYIIVSAAGKRFSGDNKITDILYMCKAQMDHNIPPDQLIQVVMDRYSAMKVDLGLDVDLESRFEEIKENIKKGCTEAYLVSRGEYLSAILTAAFLGYDFVDAAGLVQFDAKGRLMGEETNAALSAELAKHERAVIPGFYGSRGASDEIVVFSRGGSDVTGSIVARAVNADIYENWTDVSGLLMADPRIVENPAPISRISYMELRELSYMGANVLHEDAVFPVRAAEIPINIRNTNKPEDPGTIITNDPKYDNDKVISGIAGNKDFTVIFLYKNMLNREKGFIRRALTVLEDNDISVEHVPTGIDTISLVIANSELEGKLEEVLDDLQRTLEPDTMKVYENISLIATVGRGMSFKPGVSARLFTALAEAGINIRMIDQGSSEVNIIIGVETPDFEKAIRAVYHAFA